MSDPLRATPDDALVGRSRGGDADALTELYRRHAPALLRYVERLTGDRASAEDILQESFVRIFEQRGRYTGRGRFRSWLFTVATRLARDRARTARRRGEIAGAFAVELAPPPAGDPMERVRRLEILREIESALADLPPAYAATFQLRICEGFGYREIGEMLGEPEGTLRSRVHHALRRVRAALEAKDLALEGMAPADDPPEEGRRHVTDER